MEDLKKFMDDRDETCEKLHSDCQYCPYDGQCDKQMERHRALAEYFERHNIHPGDPRYFFHC